MIVGVFWERCRYDWSVPGTVTATVLDSNVFRPASTFELRAVPREGGGSAVEMVITRNFRNGIKGTIARAINHVATGDCSGGICATALAAIEKTANIEPPIAGRRQRHERLGSNLRRRLRPHHVGAEKATLRAHREALIPQAKGRVLEIGGGTGANLPFYEDTETLTLTEPDKPMVHRLERRLQEQSPGGNCCALPPRICRSRTTASSGHLHARALHGRRPATSARELRRVLKPGGRLLFIEHVRADDQRLARWQDRLNGLQTCLGHGCNCNRPTIDTITAAGFKITKLERDVLRKTPPILAHSSSASHEPTVTLLAHEVPEEPRRTDEPNTGRA